MRRPDRLALAGRLALLAFAVLSVWANGLFAFTDKAWVLMGSPPESFPEIFFRLTGLPLALAGLVGALSGLWTELRTRGRSGMAHAAVWTTVTSVLGSSLLAASVFLPPGADLPDPLGTVVGMGLIPLSPLLLLAQLALAWTANVGPRRL